MAIQSLLSGEKIDKIMSANKSILGGIQLTIDGEDWCCQHPVRMQLVVERRAVELRESISLHHQEPLVCAIYRENYAIYREKLCDIKHFKRELQCHRITTWAVYYPSITLFGRIQHAIRQILAYKSPSFIAI